MDQTEGRLREDEQKEGKLASKESKKSFLEDHSANLKVLDKEK